MFFFQHFNLSALGFGGAMASIDAVVLSSLKAYNIGWLTWPGIPLISMIVYACQPILFLESLKFTSLVIMNQTWDVMSDVIVAIIGLFYFKEKMNVINKVGILFSFISIILLSWK